MYKRAVLNFIKIVTKNAFDKSLNNYDVLVSFLKKFDNNINLTRSNYDNYRSRNTKLFPFIITKRSEKFELRRSLIAWNTSLAIFSFWGACRLVPELLHFLTHHGLMHSVCDTPYKNSISVLW